MLSYKIGDFAWHLFQRHMVDLVSPGARLRPGLMGCTSVRGWGGGSHSYEICTYFNSPICAFGFALGYPGRLLHLMLVSSILFAMTV